MSCYSLTVVQDASTCIYMHIPKVNVLLPLHPLLPQLHLPLDVILQVHLVFSTLLPLARPFLVCSYFNWNQP